MTVDTTEQLAKFVVHTSSNDIPAEAIAQAKNMFVNIIGVTLSATVVGKAGKITIKYIKDIGGTPEAIVIGGGFRTSTPNAAFANGLLAHALDFDDWEMEARPWHPSAMLVAASLALGEKLNLPGRTILEAYILGLEVYAKIMLGSADIGARGWCGTAITGTMGAVAAAARLLGLNVQQTRMAFGIAASGASGILRQAGTMTKPYHLGNAARNGIEAALLAKDGFTSDESIIENPKGYSDCFAGQGTCDYSKMTKKLGNPFHIVSPSLGLKPYPCCIQEYRSIEAILELIEQHGFTYEDVDCVEVAVSPIHYQRLNFLEPRTGLQAKFSVNYAVAAALLDGKLTVATFTDERVDEPKMKEALGKIKVIVDETIPEDWTNTWNLVTVRLKDGKIFSTKRSAVPKGDTRNPLSASDLVTKYRENALLVLSEAEVAHSISLLQNLEQAEHISELTDILIGKRL